MSGIVFVLVDDFIQVFMKEQWLPIVPAVKVLCFFGMTRSLNAVMGSLFMATGNPHVITLVGSLQLVLLAIIIVPLTIFFGITGTACAVVIPNTAALLYLMVRLPHSVNITPLRYIRNLLPPLCGCTMILLMLSYLKTGSTVGSGYGMFFINVCIGIALYFSTTFLVDRVCGGELLQTLKHIQGLVRTDGA
jgi:O-antigen/teichoic acid export membrane protein